MVVAGCVALATRGARAGSHAVLSRQVVVAAVAGALIAVFAGTATDTFATVRTVLFAKSTGSANRSWSIAQAMRRDGVPADARIALVGAPDVAYWVRAGRMHIVDVVPAAHIATFWQLPDSARTALVAFLAGTGANAVVVATAPDSLPVGWRHVAGGALWLPGEQPSLASAAAQHGR
jgi:hypothetical protein